MKDRDTLEMFPSLDNTKVKRPTDLEKYEKIIIEKYQTNLFKTTNNQGVKNGNL